MPPLCWQRCAYGNFLLDWEVMRTIFQTELHHFGNSSLGLWSSIMLVSNVAISTLEFLGTTSLFVKNSLRALLVILGHVVLQCVCCCAVSQHSWLCSAEPRICRELGTSFRWNSLILHLSPSTFQSRSFVLTFPNSPVNTSFLHWPSTDQTPYSPPDSDSTTP